MMKKLGLKFALLTVFALGLCGCSTLNYVGEDYSENNITMVKTEEDMVFNTYKKTTDNANIKMGITRTPVPEILSLYIQIENLSYDTPYVFKVEDLRLSDPMHEIQFITSSNYLSIYQNQEASSITAMSNLGATLSNMTGMTAQYNEFNQSVAQTSAQESNRTAFARMEQVGNQIMKHTIKYSSTISPRRSQYFYFFFEDNDEFPITIKYKNLEYQFEL